MKVITLAKTKELLGITDSASDASITAKIPLIDAKVKKLCNNNFNMIVIADIVNGSTSATIRSVFVNNNLCYKYTGDGYYKAGINNFIRVEEIGEYIHTGDLISGTGIQADTYIDEIYLGGITNDFYGYSTNIPTITLSSAATSSGEIEAYIGINIAYQDIIAKGIQYLINKTSTEIPSNALSSRSIGPSSKSFSSKAQVKEGINGMPAWFNSAFPVFHTGH